MALPRDLPPREIVFIDPDVSDIARITGNLRPGIAAVLLDSAVPAAQQIAAALADCRGLDAVHVIAHGSPGYVSFAAGDWSAEAIEDEAEDFAAIGKALAASSDLRLWSCETGAGDAGAAFIEHLEQATGIDVAAAAGRVGAAVLGGSWQLTAAARPPLTAAGMAGYTGVLAVTLTSTGTGEGFAIFGRWRLETAAGTYFVVLNNSGQLQVLGRFIVPAKFPGTFAISADLPAGSYTVGSDNAGPGTITVYSGRWSPDSQREGTWSVGEFDPAITATLNYSRNTASNFTGAI